MDATNAECRRCSVGGAGGILVRTRDGSALRKWRGQLDGPELRHGRVSAWVACCSSRPRSALHNAPDLAFMLPVYVSRQAPDGPLLYVERPLGSLRCAAFGANPLAGHSHPSGFPVRRDG